MDFVLLGQTSDFEYVYAHKSNKKIDYLCAYKYIPSTKSRDSQNWMAPVSSKPSYTINDRIVNIGDTIDGDFNTMNQAWAVLVDSFPISDGVECDTCSLFYPDNSSVAGRYMPVGDHIYCFDCLNKHIL